MELQVVALTRCRLRCLLAASVPRLSMSSATPQHWRHSRGSLASPRTLPTNAKRLGLVRRPTSVPREASQVGYWTCEIKHWLPSRKPATRMALHEATQPNGGKRCAQLATSTWSPCRPTWNLPSARSRNSSTASSSAQRRMSPRGRCLAQHATATSSTQTLTDSITSPRPFLHASWLSRTVPS